MKTPVLLALAVLAGAPLPAQIFGPNAASGVLLGGLAGGIIGYNNHHQTGRGVAIGAASGLLLGAIADQADCNSHQAIQAPVSRGYVHRTAPAYYYPDYTDAGYDYIRPDYAMNGALFGGLLGGIIGYNNHHQTGRGAVIGTAAGLLLGGLAEQDARAREVAASQAPVAAAPAPVTVINNYYNRPAPTAMSGANALFGRN